MQKEKDIEEGNHSPDLHPQSFESTPPSPDRENNFITIKKKSGTIYEKLLINLNLLTFFTQAIISLVVIVCLLCFIPLGLVDQSVGFPLITFIVGLWIQAPSQLLTRHSSTTPAPAG